MSLTLGRNLIYLNEKNYLLGDNYLFYGGSNKSITDCNDAPLGLSLTYTDTLNTPAIATMTLLTYGNYSGHILQLCLRATGVIYFRGYAGGWSDWKQVQMTNV